ncbi:MAG: endonuclease/exonuclease/phosphatase family protein [Paludibacter sp.]|nr:endonuclease/exonuclease/phosphatase family protein [Paludibacter sp.]
MNPKLNFITLCAILFCTWNAFAGTKLPKDNIRIGIYNIRGENPNDGVNLWKFRKDSLSKIVLSYNIEIVGLQEAKQFQLEDILARTNYKYVGKEGLLNPIIYNTDRFEVIEWNMFWFSESMEPNVKGWDARYERYCTWAKFKDKKTKREFYFFNTHFDHRGLVAKTNSAKLISSEAKKIAGNAPIILAGDMNSWISTEAYRILASNFSDAKVIAPEERVYGPIGTAHNFGGVHPVQIDYIFVNDKVKVHTYRVIDEAYENNFYPSDHYPLYIDATIKK